MTPERASELVKALKDAYPKPDTKAADLLEHFASILVFKTPEDVRSFVRMCGFEKSRTSDRREALSTR